MSVYCLISSGDLQFLPIDEAADDEKHLDSTVSLIHNSVTLSSSPSVSSLNSSSSREDLTNTPIVMGGTHTGSSNNNQSITANAAYLPEYSIDLSDTSFGDESGHIKKLLVNVFPSWLPEKIIVKQLTGGITNMLLSCKHENENVLVRTYGKGTNLIIDRDREFISHLLLNSLNLAPKIYARFSNGLVYGFLPGRSLSPDELSNPYLYPLIAQKLGYWHHRINAQDIEDGIVKLKTYKIESLDKSTANFTFIKNLWQLIDAWIDIIPEIPEIKSSFKKNSHISEIGDTDTAVKEALHKEFSWLSDILKNNSSPTIVAHADLLSGNIIIPDSLSLEPSSLHPPSPVPLPSILENPVQFIDYEYMLPAPRGFDIANHLAEWQGFNCDRAKIPSPTIDNKSMVNWAKAYLSGFMKNDSDKRVNDHEISQLIEEVNLFFGMPGFYWGVWAAIQSTISQIDFNYREYAIKRFEEYWDWKRDFLDNKRLEEKS